MAVKWGQKAGEERGESCQKARGQAGILLGAAKNAENRKKAP
jgi:hypothetical protein